MPSPIQTQEAVCRIQRNGALQRLVRRPIGFGLRKCEIDGRAQVKP